MWRKHRLQRKIQRKDTISNTTLPRFKRDQRALAEHIRRALCMVINHLDFNWFLNSSSNHHDDSRLCIMVMCVTINDDSRMLKIMMIVLLF